MTRLGNGRLRFAALALLVFCGAAPAAAKPPSATNLLFTFVTNQAGFDTSLTIANTSADPFGTTPVEGTCTLHFFGANAPPASDTLAIPAGTVFATLASTVAPGFQGYLIAACDIPLLHGWAVVGGLGLNTLGAGYPALVIPPGKRKKLERLDN